MELSSHTLGTGTHCPGVWCQEVPWSVPGPNGAVSVRECVEFLLYRPGKHGLPCWDHCFVASLTGGFSINYGRQRPPESGELEQNCACKFMRQAVK